MEPLPPSTDPALIRRVLARLRHWERAFAGSQTGEPAPIMRHRVTLQLVLDDAVDDLNRVKPDWMEPWMMQSVDDSELDTPEVMSWFFHWYGFADYFFGEDPRVVQTDRFGVLYQLGDFDADGSADYHGILKAVLVEDAVRQADGSAKTHLLPVPPEIPTARAAVAWTFGFSNPKQYQPQIET